MTPADIGAHIEIGQVIQRYGLALDDKRFDDLDRVFHRDGQLHYEMPDGSANHGPYADWKKLFAAFLKPFYWTSHLFSSPVVTLEGDEAESRCRLIAVHVQQPQGGGDRSLWTVYGTYRDALVHTDAGWRIRERHFRGVHTEGRVLPADQVETFSSLPFQP